MRRIGTSIPAFIVLFAIAATLFAAPTIIREIGIAETEVDIKLARQELRQNDILTQLNAATRAVAQVSRPSVVHIESRRNQPGRSSGSGWVYDTEGHVVTNAHVVRDTRSARVHFSDGTSSSATVVGSDDFTDVAVLKLDRSRTLFPATRATGEVLEQGDRVFVFGSPFGFRFSMSEGIISGLGRNAPGVVGAMGFSNFIQTDAAVNPGNSGGPLIDALGHVVGMTVAIATGSDTTGTSETGQSAGISFAIPLRTIENVVDQFIEKGEVDRGFLGISMLGTAAIRDPVSGETSIGVDARSINAGSAADIAGLVAGDIVLSIDRQPTTSVEALRSIVTSTRPGVKVSVRVARQNDDGNGVEFLDLPLVLGTFPAASLSLSAYGLAFFDSSPDDPPTISETARDSKALRDGFARGMTVLRVEDRRVLTMQDLFTALEDFGFHRGQPVTVEVRLRADSTETERKTIVSPQSVRSPE